MVKKLVVFASGRGSNFEALAKGISEGKIKNAQIIALLSNRPQCNAIAIAKRLQIPTIVVDSSAYLEENVFDRATYDSKVIELLTPLKPDFICLAGYMLILSTPIIEAYPNQIVNIHPSLLPAFKGLKPQKQALESGVRQTGCTVHFVSPEVDAGPIIDQEVLEILPEDTERSLKARLLPVEHVTYVRAINRLCNSTFQVRENKVVWLDSVDQKQQNGD